MRRNLLLLLIGTIVSLASQVVGVDCNLNGVDDPRDVSEGTSEDCNESGIPDECEQALLELRHSGETTQIRSTPSYFVAGDLDGDGDPDFAAGSPRAGESNLWVYLNQIGEEGPQISESARYITEPRIRGVRLSDVDGDDDLDVIVGAQEAVQIFTNDGTGTLSEPMTIALAANSSAVAVADVNGDGHVDLVVPHDDEAGGAQVSILLAKAPPAVGEFREAQVLRGIAGGARTSSADIADMDGDGDLDVVTFNAEPTGISIFLNEGCADNDAECSFSEVIAVPMAEEPSATRAAHLDDDTSADLVFASRNNVVILRNNGDGRTFENESFRLPTNDLEIADLDFDGDLDVISGMSTQTLAVLINGGDGHFQSTVDLEVGSRVASFVAADFDGRNGVDLATVTGSRQLGFLWNGVPQPTAFSSSTLSLTGNPPHSAAAVDVDGDGDLDILAGTGGTRSVRILINDPPGSFRAGENVRSSDRVDTIAHADFDRDGDIDLVLTGLWYAENRGHGTFSRLRRIAPGASSAYLLAADLNDDGWPDLIGSQDRRLSINLNDGAGALPRSRTFNIATAARNPAAGDFDGDGDLDVAVGSFASRALFVVLNRGNGEFDDAVLVAVDPRGLTAWFTAGDWNGDGVGDLAIARPQEFGVRFLTGVRGAEASFKDFGFVALGTTPFSMESADINSDGHLDIVTSNESGDNIAILLNDSGEGFDLGGTFSAGDEPRFTMVGDFNLDGAPDAAALNRSSMDMTVFLNRNANGRRTFVEKICTLRDFSALSVKSGGEGRLSVKYTVPARDDPTLVSTVFQNTKRHPLHHEFLRTAFSDVFPGLTADGLIGITQLRATRDYYIGAVERVRTADGFLFLFSIVTGAGRDEVLSLEEVQWVYERLSESLTLGSLFYAPDPAGENPLARKAAQAWDDAPFPIFDGTVDVDVEYIPYTQEVGYGRVRLLNREDFDAANAVGRFTFQDIIVIDHAPRDIEGVVGGVITAARQGALSHISVRTARRGTPNAFVDKALLLFEPFDGELVRLEVGERDFTVEPASLADADRFWSERDSLPEPQPFDSDYRGLDRFEEMDFSIGGALEARFGGKATGLARLQTILTSPYEGYRERGFAIPMAYSLDFMNQNAIASHVDGREVSYQEYLDELFALEEFRTDSEFRFEMLDGFRGLAREQGVIPEGLVEAIAARIETVFGSREVMVRHRSSSNVEDLLEFNGAGLYESTSVCVEDSFDDDDIGPSVCDPERNVERTIERALKKVWTSLWTFRAHEEREFFQIPQASAAMGILVNRAFLDEDANGVAFTGDPVNPRAGCYVVTVQRGEESVVSPEPGVLPEVNVLEVADGAVVNIVRSQASTLVDEGDVVLTDEKLQEFGSLMWHIDETYPVNTDGHPRQSVLLDIEFKLEADGSLAVKQIRPFLVPGDPPVRPTFELVIPDGLEACGSMNLRAPSGDPRLEYEAKSLVRFRPGTVELSAERCVATAELFDEVLIGPDREIAVAEGLGLFRVFEQPEPLGPGTQYVFTYEQRFTLPSGGGVEIKIFNLEFVARNGVPLVTALVLDDAYLTFDLTMRGFVTDPDRAITYGSCTNSELPIWNVAFDLDDGTSVRLTERFLPSENLTATGPASLAVADVDFGGSSQRMTTSYWDLVYSSARHNAAVTYWILLDSPVSLPGIDGEVHALALDAADSPELSPFVVALQEEAAAYLDENFEVLARPGVLSFAKAEVRFRRGDANVDGAVDIADPVRIVDGLFRDGEALACEKAADANDDGSVSVTDAVWTLLALFRGGALPEPTDTCGGDPTEDSLSCDTFVCP